MLPFSVSLRPGLPIFEQVVHAASRAIASGQLRPGDAFPSVRALSQSLRINPNTAHRIVASLVEDGVLEVRPGMGTVVASRPGAGAASTWRRRLDADVERVVITARMAGMSLQEVVGALRRCWPLGPPRGARSEDA